MTEKQAEALDRLNRGIEDSRAEAQRQTMSLAQEYFDDSADTLKQQIGENRAALEGLPDQIPGGRDEAFRMMFQELMDNYTAMEHCIGEAQARVADLDTDDIRRQGEVDATDAARRDAKELGIDLTEVEGTGSEGRVTVDDVKEHSENLRNASATDQAEEVAGQAKDTARGMAERSQDAAGQVADQAQEIAGSAAGQAQDAAGQATDQVGQVAGQAQDAAGGAAEQAQDAAGQATDQVGQVAGQATDAVGGLTGGGQEENGQGGGGPLGGVTDQVGQVAGQAQDAATGAAQQTQDVAGQAQDVAGQAQEAAGSVTNQTGQVADQAQDATRQIGEEDNVQKQGIIASDAARREAREKGIDLSTIKGTGAEGRIVYWDVADLPSQKGADPAPQVGDRAGQVASGVAGQAGGIANQVVDQASGEEPRVTKAARRKAEDMGRDLSQIKGSGVGGLITISDVVRG